MRRPFFAPALAPALALGLAACGGPTSRAEPANDVSPVTPKPDAGPAPIDLGRMVLVPAGSFPMGHATADPGMYGAEWKENELPQHPVTLSAFYIDRDEVTVGDYARFLDAYGDASAHDAHQPIRVANGLHEPLPGAEKLPIAFVSWFDAEAFCAFAGKSLPTEAEWERAAKGPSGDHRYPWGDDGPTCTKAVFTSQARCEDALASVGSRSPAGDSPEGCHDLSGNVAEWVLDWYARYPPTGAGPAADPKGPEDGTLRVVRGGAASDPPAAIRTTSRFGADPSNRSEGVGFRCVHHL
jgi:formylglycine-generating enzyme required for sulfatase activity